MKYIKTIKDNKIIVNAVPASFTEKDLPEGATFTTKSFFRRVKKHNQKMAVASGSTKKGRPENITRGIGPEHLKYGNLYGKKDGKIILKNQGKAQNS
jgi:hypothetical protein